MWIYFSVAAVVGAFALIVPARTRDRLIGCGLLLVPAVAYLLAYTPERRRVPHWGETRPGRMCEQIARSLSDAAYRADAFTARPEDKPVPDEWREFDELERDAYALQYAALRQFAARALDLCVATPGTCGALLERMEPGSAGFGEMLKELNGAFWRHGACSLPSELTAGIAAEGGGR